MALFFKIIYNIPEILLESKFTNKRCIKYQFKVYGKITIKFIKVKTGLEGFNEYLDYVIQIITECNSRFKSR